MDAFEILVVALSIALGLFLVAAIVFVLGLIKLVNQVRLIMKKAEEIVEDVETVSHFFKRTATPVAITGFISNIVDTVTHFKKGRK